MKTILMNPGPVTLSERVRQALLRDDLCHREVEFAELQTAIRKKLLDVYSLESSDWTSALLTGSGTAAVEAMLTSLIPLNGSLLIVENGVYGERMTRIAERYGISHYRARHEWATPIAIENVRAQLSEHPDITHVAVVHHETTTGRLNDLAPLAALCREHNVRMFVDAVSSFGAEVIDFQHWPIAAAAATANKCLHGVPGTCFVILRRDSLSAAHARNVYLDVASYVAAQDQSGTPFTQSIQTFYALDEALDELADEGGVDSRRAIYQSRMSRIRSWLTRRGVSPLLDESETSCVLHAYALPSEMSYEELHDGLKRDGFIIYAGQGELAATIFRLSMMGDIGPGDLERLEASLAKAFDR